MLTHYSILGLPHTATGDEIKSAYRLLANIHHPDKGGNASYMELINRAYATLSKPDLRRQYDGILASKGNPQRVDPAARASSSNSTINPDHSAEILRQSLAILTSARARAKNMARSGLIWVLTGLIAMALLYVSTPGESFFLVALVAVLYGGYRIVMGIYYAIFPGTLIGRMVSASSKAEAHHNKL